MHDHLIRFAAVIAAAVATWAVGVSIAALCVYTAGKVVGII